MNLINWLVGVILCGVLCLPVVSFSADESMAFKVVTRCSENAPLDAQCSRIPQEFAEGTIILAQGKIERNSEVLFTEVSKGIAPGAVVVLNSLGGDLIGGLRLGQAIRSRDFHTLILSTENLPINASDLKLNGKCFSACAYTFLGGTIRRVDANAQFGVHQFRNEENKLDASQAQKMSALLARYLDAMGVNRQLLDQALLTEPGKMTLINDKLRKAWAVETGFSQTSQTRWRIEAVAGGKRLAYVSRKQLTRNAILTIAMTYHQGSLKTMLLVKPDPRDEFSGEWANQFGARVDVVIEVNSKTYRLQPITDWERAGSVNSATARQIWFNTPDGLVKDFLVARQFLVKPLWESAPIGMDGESYLGTEGFEDNFKAL